MDKMPWPIAFALVSASICALSVCISISAALFKAAFCAY
jgi:hypothetical protein